MSTHYVLGFLFTEPVPPLPRQVVLIQKTHGPANMAGTHNGVGGKVNPGELSLDAMQREFKEEAGVVVTEWDKFMVMHGPDWMCDCYRAFDSDAARACFTTTDEDIFLLNVTPHAMNAIRLYGNLHWMIPLALDAELIKCKTVQRVYYAVPSFLHLANLVMAEMSPDEKCVLQKDGPKLQKREAAKRRRNARESTLPGEARATPQSPVPASGSSPAPSSTTSRS